MTLKILPCNHSRNYMGIHLPFSVLSDVALKFYFFHPNLNDIDSKASVDICLCKNIFKKNIKSSAF